MTSLTYRKVRNILKFQKMRLVKKTKAIIVQRMEEVP